MLFKSQLFTLAAASLFSVNALTQTWGSATKTTQLRSINPPVGLEALEGRSEVHLPVKRAASNAERLARGLPLNPPVRRHGGSAPPPGHHNGGHHNPHPPKPSNTYHRSTVGFLEVVDPSNGNFIGYVRKSLNEIGEFGLTADVNERLAITVDLAIATSGGSTNIAINNAGEDSYPMFGGVVGYHSTDDNLSAGSANYAYIGATNESPVNSPAFDAENSISESSLVQTAIFTYNPTTHLISAHWVNTDGSTPATSFAYLRDDDALVLVGDVAAFGAEYDSVESVAVRFVSVY